MKLHAVLSISHCRRLQSQGDTCHPAWNDPNQRG